jgi:hypothetical protein
MVGEWLCAWHATLGGLYRLEVVGGGVVMVGGGTGREGIAIEGCSCPCKVRDKEKKKKGPRINPGRDKIVSLYRSPRVRLGPSVGKSGGNRWGVS